MRIYFFLQDNETNKSGNGFSAHGEVSIKQLTALYNVWYLHYSHGCIFHLSFRLNWLILIHGLKLISQDT